MPTRPGVRRKGRAASVTERGFFTMPAGMVCPTCCQRVEPSRWPPCAPAVKCRCGTEVKDHTLGSIIEGWAVWSLFRGALVVGLGALVWDLCVYFLGNAGGESLVDLLADSAKKGILGGILLAATGACVGGVVAFCLFAGGKSNSDLLKRKYLRRYKCDICGFSGRLEPSFDWGDVNCPRCNNLLSPTD